MNKRSVLLCALLKCGPLGLKVVEGTEVDWFKVVERMDKDEPVNFKTLISANLCTGGYVLAYRYPDRFSLKIRR